MSYSKFLILGLLCIITLTAFVTMGTMPIWQPPITDATITGDGTHEDPLSVTAPIVFAAKITQASTSNPSGLEFYNGIDPSAFTYTRDSIGSYKIEGSDAAFPDSTFNFIATLGNAANGVVGITCHRATDSTLLVKIKKSTGFGIDLGGTADLLIIQTPPED